MNDINNQQNQPKTEKQKGGCVITIIAFILISLAIFLVVGSLKSNRSTPSNSNGGYSDGNSNENVFTKPFKKVAPTATLECTLTGIIINIQCNDNYDYIIIRVELLDKNNNVVKSFTMRENDMKKGELRQAEYKFSIGEVFTSNLVQARIEEYK